VRPATGQARRVSLLIPDAAGPAPGTAQWGRRIGPLRKASVTGSRVLGDCFLIVNS